jgi:hypothetical protein
MPNHPRERSWQGLLTDCELLLLTVRVIIQKVSANNWGVGGTPVGEGGQ